MARIFARTDYADFYVLVDAEDGGIDLLDGLVVQVPDHRSNLQRIQSIVFDLDVTIAGYLAIVIGLISRAASYFPS